MNKKLIVAAVSAAVIAPVAAQAGDAEIYGNITNSINLNSPDGNKADGTSRESSTNMETLSSRVGIKYSADLGNGLTANAKYEVAVNSDNEGQKVVTKVNTADDDDTASLAFGKLRVGTVGLSGSFGSVTLGQQWSSYFNTYGTMVSPTYTVGHAAGPGIFRTGDTIKYGNSFGPVSMELDYRLNEGDGSDAQDNNGYGIGFTVSPMDNMSIAVAHDSQEDKSAITARAVADVIADIGVDTASGIAGVAAVNDGDNATEVAALNKQAVSLGVAPTSNEVSTDGADKEYTGVAVSYDFGVVKATVGVAQVERGDSETDKQVLLLSGNITEKTSWLLIGAKAEDQDDFESSSTTWGVYHSMGGGVTLGYEALSIDHDKRDDDLAEQGGTNHNLFMRVNF